MLSLVIGDFFIPERVMEIPPKFCKLLAPNAPSIPSNPKISQVLCLGNITQSTSTLRFLHNLSPEFHIVRAEYDNYTLLCQQLALLGQKSESTLSFYKVITADNFRIGITSGHQDVPRHDPLLLLAFAREIEVDILVWGGSRHVEAYTLDGKFFISPGSATGAFSIGWPEIDEKGEDYEDDEDQKNAEVVDVDTKPEVEEINELDKSNSEDVPSTSDKIEEFPNRKRSETETGDSNTANEKEKEKEEPEFDDTQDESSIPSFCLLDTQGSQCTLYIYTQVNGEVKVDKVMYHKEV